MNRAHVEAEAWYDVIRLAEFLGEARRNREAARELLREFDRKCEIYARQPGMGDLREDLGKGRRSFTFKRWYVAVYEPMTEGINVVRVFDGRSDYAKHFDA